MIVLPPQSFFFPKMFVLRSFWDIKLQGIRQRFWNGGSVAKTHGNPLRTRQSHNPKSTNVLVVLSSVNQIRSVLLSDSVNVEACGGELHVT
jgi:hypothetical protein